MTVSRRRFLQVDAEHAARVAAESNASKAGSAAYKLEGLLDRERKARVKAERERDRLREAAALFCERKQMGTLREWIDTYDDSVAMDALRRLQERLDDHADSNGERS